MKVKKVQKKKYTPKEKGIKKYNHEILGLLLLSFSILVTISLYMKDSIGIFGSYVRSIMFGMSGFPAYFIPPILVIYAVFMMFKRDSKEFKTKVLFICILIFLLSAILHTGYYNPIEYEAMTISSRIVKFFSLGKVFMSGGVIGGVIGTPFIDIFQKIGTIIILSTLAVIDIIMLTNISIESIFRGLIGSLSSVAGILKNALREREVKSKIQGMDFDKEDLKDDKKDYKLLDTAQRPKIMDFFAEKDTLIKSKANKKKMAIEEPVEEISINIKDAQEYEEPVINETKKPKQRKTEKEYNLIEIIPMESSGEEYRFPHVGLLDENTGNGVNIKALRNSAMEGAKKLEDTLKSFGVDAKVINVSRGPAVTRYELQPSPGVKVSKIVGLADDISLNLASAGVRIEAPIPGKAAVGIEVPNKEVTPVLLREIIESEEFTEYPSKLAFTVGKDISGEIIVADIAKMPHLLIAGATGSGKSVCINSLIASILYKASPDEVKLLMIDPKVVELGIYNGIPHLLIPVVTDPKKASGALNWAVQEMVNRYKLFAEKGVRDIKGYNAYIKESTGEGILPHVVIIIDELADLMMVAPHDIEDAICRLAQMARAAGMHLVIATQRPSVDVITGVIKANVPSRISFAVSSQVDSRTILDMAGAEKLLGRGDMLFYPVGQSKPLRVKGAFVSDKEVEKIVEFIKNQGNTIYDESIIEEINNDGEKPENNPGDNDELLPQAINLVVDAGQASVSLIQRKFKVGYARAARIVDQMEERGIVSPYEGSKPRQVLISRQQLHELQMAKEAVD